MIRKGRGMLIRMWAYWVVAMLIAAPCLGARWWSLHTTITMDGVLSDAPFDPTRDEYLVPRGGNVNLWVENLVDEDGWEEIGNPSNWGYANDCFQENDIIWAKNSGGFLEVDNGNNNNNNAPAPGRGHFVCWRPGDDTHVALVGVDSVEDQAYMPPGDEPYPYGRKDGPIVGNFDVVLFRVYEILGPDTIWYWGQNPDVSALYKCTPMLDGKAEGETYEFSHHKGVATYTWRATFPLAICHADADAGAEWVSELQGMGSQGYDYVKAKFLDGFVGPNPVGLLTCDCDDPDVGHVLHGSKLVEMRTPASVSTLDWNSADGRKIINSQWGVFNRPYEAQRHVGKHYDENINEEKDPWAQLADNGYTTLVGYFLEDSEGERVPYWYQYYEFFIDTNDGQGHTLYQNENWTWKYGDMTMGGSGFSGPCESHDSIWCDKMRTAYVQGSGQFPQAEYPHMPTRAYTNVQWANGEWRFGQKDTQDPAILTHPCNWLQGIDCGRHN